LNLSNIAVYVNIGVMDTSARSERLLLYLKRAGELIKAKQADGPEFEEILQAIRKESEFLTPQKRNIVLEKFFDLWDQKN
jgi:hypothetical protein